MGRMGKPAYIAVWLLLIGVGCQSAYSPDEAVQAQLPSTVDFNFHIKPILSDRCFTCHGPDRNALKADLRLDTYEGAFEQALESGKRAFVAGSLRKSEAFQRMIATDPDFQMPPPEFQRQLSAYERALIAQWIDEGAEHKPHWAFLPVQKPDVPPVDREQWVRNPIDRFVLKKLEDCGLSPNEEADKETLLRRVTLDLTGLPPTPEAIDAFLADSSPDAYEKVIDRLLATPQYGERMALEWLDVARYADSNGYSQDGLRIMWPWRDWVIEAFNQNMPFDQFISWQIAGDKMPNATQEQRLATAFLRNHRQNGEGGIVEEEYRVEYVADRTETVATAFLGLTLQCARCHDHKYDPISQEEYYQMFGFFNSVNESGMAQNDGNSGPQVLLTNQAVDTRITELDEAIATQSAKIEAHTSQIPRSRFQEPTIDLRRSLLVDLDFESLDEKPVNPNVSYALQGEVVQHEGVVGKALQFTGYDYMAIAKEALAFDRSDAFSLSFYLNAAHETAYMAVLNHLGSSVISYPGYEVAILDGYPTLRLVHALPANLIAVRTPDPITTGEWTHYTFTYDGSGQASGIRIYIDGKHVTPVVLFDQLSQNITNNRRQLRIGGHIDYQADVEGHGLIDELKIYGRTLSAVEASLLYHSDGDDLTGLADAALKEHHLMREDRGYQALTRELQQLRKQKFAIQDTLLGVMVMEDLPTSRPTYVLERGAYDAPRQRVELGTPAALPSFPEGEPLDRSGLASWLVDRQNPLTARVTVNRFWQQYFGEGLVRTPEDFGNQGALPTHPALLDWLAAMFMESGWDTKALQKRIVLSATYRQSSRVAEGVRASDPENTMLARGPSYRLPAELIRDVVLEASGLLVHTIGGPSVKPYQPEGLWSEKGEFSILKNYEQDEGEALYRRGMYTFWRRSSPLPFMTTFDAPNRDVCTVRRQETNTPLQALVLLNDPQFVEAARILAERVLRETPDRTAAITLAHRRLSGHVPAPDVLEVLIQLAEREHTAFAHHPERAEALLAVGATPADDTLPPAEVAALTMVCSTIMSFDETLMKR